MMRKAASSLHAFRSLRFVLTISMTCLRVTLPTLVLLGSLEPAAMLAAFFNKIAAGGLFVVEGKDFSFLKEITTGKKSPALFLVGGVYFFEDDIIFGARGAGAVSHRGGGGIRPAG